MIREKWPFCQLAKQTLKGNQTRGGLFSKCDDHLVMDYVFLMKTGGQWWRLENMCPVSLNQPVFVLQLVLRVCSISV
jgi:hypothetical protein